MSALSIAVSPSRRLASGLFQYVVLEEMIYGDCWETDTLFQAAQFFIVQALIYLTGR